MARLLIAVLICALLLSGCHFLQESEPTDTIPTQPSTNSSVSYALLTLRTYEEYTSFVNENAKQLPENFVTWDDMEIMGDVQDLLFYKGIFEDYSEYCYTVLDSAGQRIGITIEPAPTVEEKKNVIAFNPAILQGGTMRKISSDNQEPVVVLRNDVEYHYSVVGILVNIVFYRDNLRYSIISITDGVLQTYPANRSDTFVGKLLSTDEAVANAAFAEITEKLSK